MGLVDLLAGGTAYLDANVFIYAIEQVREFTGLLAGLLPAIDRAEVEAVTSELTLAETLVKPLRDGNDELAADYVAAIRPRPALRAVPVSREILVAAAGTRATTNLKLPDAIHAATALQCGCAKFVTNDARFRVVSGLDVVVLGEMVRQP